MPVHYDIETDSLYLKGKQKERAAFEKERAALETSFEKERAALETAFEKERQTNIIRLWQTGIEPSMISNVLNLPIQQVENVLSEFRKNKNGK